MLVLNMLTEEGKCQAFTRAQTETNLTEGKLVRITEDHYDQALAFLREYYHADEPMCKAVDASWGEEIRKMHIQTLCQNLSVMIVNEQNGETMAILTIREVRKGDSPNVENYEDDDLKVMLQYEQICEKKAKLFDYFSVEEALRFESLATSRNYRQRGLGSQIVRTSLAMVRNLGVGMVCVRGEGSSLFTQKIFEKEGMACIYTSIYDEYEVEGKRVFRNTGIHRCRKIYGVVVQTGSR